MAEKKVRCMLPPLPPPAAASLLTLTSTVSIRHLCACCTCWQDTGCQDLVQHPRTAPILLCSLHALAHLRPGPQAKQAAEAAARAAAKAAKGDAAAALEDDSNEETDPTK